MRFSIVSALSLVGAGMVAALPSEGALVAPVKRSTTTTSEKVQQAAASLKGNTVENESETSDCVGSLLCCGSLTTPLDHIIDPILEDLGVDASAIVGSIGLLCDPYEASICTSAPQCCTEANLLSGTVALGCSALKK
ncbi:uncharacterized protein N7484_010313 [Penicillium longicatenatum]|uniref:uncharacterized protein n=1 Tax=Penicillium longicatenatum TaxID=1561947 RepID=UPI002547565E|nr:uncharacterized protein N7484_010313 [Penicillium longicatenatum]KAJ5630213.1 hypothetical protein N7484_010313 [Penicillium longicatenatum]